MPSLARVIVPETVPVDVKVKVTPLLATPTVTTTGPVVALLGTGATIVVELQLVNRALTPLNVTLLVLGVGPKPDPEIATKVFAPPDVGEMLVIFGT